MDNATRKTLRQWREAAKLTPDQLAHECGLTGASAISNYETGWRTPSIDMLKKIRDALGRHSVVLTLDVLAESLPEPKGNRAEAA